MESLLLSDKRSRLEGSPASVRDTDPQGHLGVQLPSILFFPSSPWSKWDWHYQTHFSLPEGNRRSRAKNNFYVSALQLYTSVLTSQLQLSHIPEKMGDVIPAGQN